ncbi:hypothetical protein AQUCO_07400027v1 [Aquilegia coerulea]|uniref:Uncharacterized protein n=1 Tax=Aquilegia coerulea TaxID=218851 RepID=A0A2G5C9E0_AQUCA|nr:hypothetical protein AQUCO_07400027v1 [Aquilegia coerulea]
MGPSGVQGLLPNPPTCIVHKRRDSFFIHNISSSAFKQCEREIKSAILLNPTELVFFVFAPTSFASISC